ncbi:MAG: hypothetical protein IPP69_15245 [Flavobacteriales bacterium]|nr:hypothetical protein [Flavobacteriales bacterium]
MVRATPLKPAIVDGSAFTSDVEGRIRLLGSRHEVNPKVNKGMTKNEK